MKNSRPLAVVTGASTGIGHELARCCAVNGFDLVIAADEPGIHAAAAEFRKLGVRAEAVETDLSTTSGVDELCDMVERLGRSVDSLICNAGHGLGQGFLDQEWSRIRHLIDTNITGTIYLIHRLGREMRKARRGRILIVGSIAGYIPGSFQAAYHASKAFLDNFAFALRNELSDFNITVTCLIPGATDTEFFRRAGMLDTRVGQSKKADPAVVAQDGFNAMMSGEAEVVSGWRNKIRVALAGVTPAAALAERSRRSAQPGTGKAAA